VLAVDCLNNLAAKFRSGCARVKRLIRTFLWYKPPNRVLSFFQEENAPSSFWSFRHPANIPGYTVVFVLEMRSSKTARLFGRELSVSWMGTTRFLVRSCAVTTTEPVANECGTTWEKVNSDCSFHKNNQGASTISVQVYFDSSQSKQTINHVW
jgi:hypothetical protein